MTEPLDLKRMRHIAEAALNAEPTAEGEVQRIDFNEEFDPAACLRLLDALDAAVEMCGGHLSEHIKRLDSGWDHSVCPYCKARKQFDKALKGE